MTDESPIYTRVGKEFTGHQTMIHSGREYVNKRGFTTNNVENFFLQFKRGMRGTYIHCGVAAFAALLERVCVPVF